MRNADCKIIVLRFVRCQWSVVRCRNNKGQREKEIFFYSMLYALCSMLAS